MMPPPPPILVMAPPPQKQCNRSCCRKCHVPRTPAPAPVAERPSSNTAWFSRIHDLDDDSLHKAAILATAALAAPDEPAAAVAELDVILVDVPRGASAGDQLEVCVPAEAGGGYVMATVPRDMCPGDTFEVPLRTENVRHPPRRRYRA